eukprot:3173702-Rhodomonas_salina.2
MEMIRALRAAPFRWMEVFHVELSACLEPGFNQPEPVDSRTGGSAEVSTLVRARRSDSGDGGRGVGG